MVVNLVEVTGVEQLVDRIKKGKYKSSNEILEKSKDNIYLLFLSSELIFSQW
jgi:hypothetical protein